MARPAPLTRFAEPSADFAGCFSLGLGMYLFSFTTFPPFCPRSQKPTTFPVPDLQIGLDGCLSDPIHPFLCPEFSSSSVVPIHLWLPGSCSSKCLDPFLTTPGVPVFGERLYHSPQRRNLESTCWLGTLQTKI